LKTNRSIISTVIEAGVGKWQKGWPFPEIEKVACAVNRSVEDNPVVFRLAIVGLLGSRRNIGIARPGFEHVCGQAIEIVVEDIVAGTVDAYAPDIRLSGRVQEIVVVDLGIVGHAKDYLSPAIHKRIEADDIRARLGRDNFRFAVTVRK